MIGEKSMEQIFDLGNNLKLIKVNIDELNEQKLNARYMEKETFEALVRNIKKRGLPETLPF